MPMKYKIRISTRLGLQAAYFLIGNAFTLLVGFPLQVFVARQLGAEKLGLFSVTEGVMSLIAGLLGFGLAQTLQKYIPVCLESKDYDGVRMLLRRSSVLLLSVGTVAMLLCWILLPVVRSYWTVLEEYPGLITVMPWMIPIGIMMYFTQMGLRGFQEIGFVVVGNSFLQLGCKAVLAVLLLLLGFGLAGYVTAVVVSMALACLWLAFGLWRKVLALPLQKSGEKRKFDKGWSHYARVMYSNSLLGTGAAFLDRFLLGLLGGPALVGILLVIKQLQQMPVVFLQMFLAVVAPMFSSAHARGDTAESRQLFHFSTDWVIRLAAPLCIFLLLFAEQLLGLYGPDFAQQGALALRILVLAQLSNLAMAPIGTMLNMSGQENPLLKLAVWELVFTVSGMYLLVPKFGLIGCVVILALSNLLQNIVIYYIAAKELGIRWFDSRYGRWPLPMLTVFAVGGLVRRHSPEDAGSWVLVLTLLLLYGVFNVVFLMQGLHEDDRMLFSYIGNRLKVKQGISGVIRELAYQHILSRIADLRGRGVYSQYADKYKCIFIHVPKAAGTSVALTLFEQGSRHVPWFDYYYANPEKFRSYYKFTFIRNPWDRVASTFFFLQRGGMDPQDAIWAEANLKGYPTFESFVKGWLNEDSINTWVHFRPQHYFICDEEGRVMMDFVGRVESMEADFAEVAGRLGCQRTLARVNVGIHDHYSRYYNDQTREIVARVYARDIELFGYSFEQR